MVWAEIRVTGKTQLVRINDNLNAQWYITEILTPHVHPFFSTEETELYSSTGQCKAHTARVMVNHHAQNGITVME